MFPDYLQSELAHVGRVSEMGRLASSLPHELNQPLTAVATYCESARDRLESEPNAETLGMVRDALDEAAEQAVRPGQIVRRLRDFMSNGEMERRVESPQRLINEASALALVGSREHGIHVQLSLDSRADLVFVADPNPARARQSHPQCHRRNDCIRTALTEPEHRCAGRRLH